MKSTFQKICGFYLLCLGMLVLGAAIVQFDLFPYNYLKEMHITRTNALYEIGLMQNKPVHHLAEEQPVFSVPGGGGQIEKEHYLVLTSLFDSKNAIRMFDEKGKVVQEWVFDPEKAIPGKKLTDLRIDLHGSTVLPDGSALANFEYEALVKLDRCGEVEWTLPNAHHSVFVTPRNTVWVPVQRLRETGMRTLKTPVLDEYLTEVDLTNGRILRSISVIEVLFQNDLKGALLVGNRGGGKSAPNDILHLNDIEELTPEKAGAFPHFKAGDLVLSLRTLNMILVVDPGSMLVKWYQVGPWHTQHDPDFQRDGTISIYDNNRDDAGGKIYGGSRILKIHPTTREIKTLYADPHFYSEKRGKHTILPNDSIVITEFSRGRVFVVNQEGEITYETVNPYENSKFLEFTNAEILPKSYFEAGFLCEETK